MIERNPLQNMAALASDAVGQAANLVQLEFRLARTELVERVKVMGAGAALALAGAVFAAAGLVLLLQALVIALVAAGMPAVYATLIVAVGCIVVAAILVAIGRKQLSADQLAPERTLDQLARDKNMVKEKLS
jgi:uncharacterized membrane protein YqjE